ncbi:hypothetical protein [Mesobacillus maritimus]|uniref:hypothetical protein n=1 Tax=Mesobacillus maritimus TaxID=1643336 RepID=UPI00384D97E2
MTYRSVIQLQNKTCTRFILYISQMIYKQDECQDSERTVMMEIGISFVCIFEIEFNQTFD